MHGAVPSYRTQGFEVTTVSMHNMPTPCEIALEVVQTSDAELDLSLEHSTARYGDDDMERFFENFLVFLTSSIQDHRQPILHYRGC